MGSWESFDRYAEEYDAWYERNRPSYESELLALKAFIPENPEKLKALEIGAGTGRFASALGIGLGLEPARHMAELARQRGLEIVLGAAELLPFKSQQFDLVLIVTSLAFFENPKQALTEVFNVLKPGGRIIAGILDRESPQGRDIESGDKKGRFFSRAHLLSTEEVSKYLAELGFEKLEICQTLFKRTGEIREIEIPEKGHGRGYFAVISARKPP